MQVSIEIKTRSWKKFGNVNFKENGIFVYCNFINGVMRTYGKIIFSAGEKYITKQNCFY